MRPAAKEAETSHSSGFRCSGSSGERRARRDCDPSFGRYGCGETSVGNQRPVAVVPVDMFTFGLYPVTDGRTDGYGERDGRRRESGDSKNHVGRAQGLLDGD